VLQLDLHAADIPAVFQRFRDEIGETFWLRPARKVRDELRGTPFLRRHLAEEYAIVLALTYCSNLVDRYGQIPRSECNNHQLYPAMGLAAQVLSILDWASPTQVTQLKRRLHGAFKNPDEMRAIQLELTATTHFAYRGYQLVWPEMEGRGTFDLLVEEIGGEGLEVECKSIGQDKGRRIHRRDAITFHHLVERELKKQKAARPPWLSVVVTVPDKLPRDHKARQLLARTVAALACAPGNTQLSDGTKVQATEFSLDLLGDRNEDGSPVDIRGAIQRVTQSEDGETMLIGDRSGRALLVTLQSAVDDSPLEAMFKTLSDSAKRQLTGSRGGMFFVGLHGLTADDLLGLATHDDDPSEAPTALRIAVSQFLSGASRDHLVGVAFLSRSALRPLSQKWWTHDGTAYAFQKRESPYWHDEFSGLFW